MVRRRFQDIIDDLLADPDASFDQVKEENERRVARDEKYRRIRPWGRPIYLNIETTRQCNLTCVMCPFHSSPQARKRWGVATGKMDIELFRLIAKELFPTLKICALSVTGEFTLTDYLPEVFRLLGRYGVKFDGFTNGVLLTPDISEMMMPHLECFTISIDSPDVEAYERIRRGARWGTVIENVRTLMATREKLRSEPRPRLDLQAVLMRSTFRTLPELVRLAKELGFDLIKGVHLGVFTEDMVEESMTRHRELYNEKREEAIETAKEVGIEIMLPPPLLSRTRSLEQRGDPPEGCEFLWRRSFINFDGSVFACCAPRPPLIGNFTSGPFNQIWRGAAIRSLRKRIFDRNPHPSCARCWIRCGDIPEGMEEELLFHLENNIT